MAGSEAEFTLDATLAQGAELISQARSLSVEGSEIPKLPGYTIQSRLGAGTFGEAWAGVQLSTGQKVAIKIFSRHQAMDWDLFRAEVQRLMEVAEHPNVVTLLDANLENVPPFFVMPLLGGSLADPELDSTASPADFIAQVASWLEEICKGLAYIHSKGILHGDLKPANLLLDSEGRVRLADFGQSFATQTGGYNLGTLGYMPPEQVLRGLGQGSEEPNARWDVYALGATAYRLLGKQVPRMDARTRPGIHSNTLRERLQFAFKVTQAPLRPLRDLIPQIDPALASIIEGCLEPLPQFRYANTEEILVDLARRREQLPLYILQPWSNLYRARLFINRNPRPFAVGALSLLLLLGTMALGWMQVEQERSEVAKREERLLSAQKEVEKAAGNLKQQVNGFAQLEEKLATVAERQGERAKAMLWWAQSLQHRPKSETVRNSLESYRYPLQQYLGGDASRVSSALAITPGGKLVALGSAQGRIDLLANQRHQVLAMAPEVCSLAARSDGQELASGGNNGQILLWRKDDEGTWKASQSRWFVRPASLLSSSVPPESLRCSQLVYSPDGKRLLAVNAEGRCLVWPGGSFQLPSPPLLATFSSTGEKILLATQGGHLRLWSPQGRPLTPEMNGTLGCLNPAEDRILRIDSEGQAIESDLGGRTLRSLGPARNVAYAGGKPVTDGWLRGYSSSRFSADGRTLTALSDHQVRVFDSRSHQPLSASLEHPGRVQHVALSNDGQILVTSDGDLRIFDGSVKQATVDSEKAVRLVERWTGTRLDPSGELVFLSPEEWSHL
jgi:serine/threonine protein kinase